MRILRWPQAMAPGRKLRMLADEDHPRVEAVVFRPDGKALASGSNDTTVLSWSPVGDNQGAGVRDRCGVRLVVLQTQVPAAALPCAIALAPCHGMTAPRPPGCAGRCDLRAEHRDTNSIRCLGPEQVRVGFVGRRAVVRLGILRDRRKETLRPNWAALAAAEMASGLLMAARSSAGTMPATAGWPSAVSSLAFGVFRR